MAEVNLCSWPEISQASKDLQLNSIAATLEYILAWHARLETRLIEHERRAAATLPPLRPEPDPPDGTPLYAATQPQFQFSGYQLPPPNTDQLPYPYTHQQPPRSKANSCWYPSNPPQQLQQGQSLPPSCWEPPYQHQQFSWPAYDL